jgi:excisionase family DNA binding protein
MTEQSASSNKPRMLTRQEVAERLGVKVRWLEDNVKTGPSFYRLNGRTIRYAEKDVENWLRQRREE